MSNTPDRPAFTTITDRGVAMIPLPEKGRTLDWWMYQKFYFHCIIWHMHHFGGGIQDLPSLRRAVDVALSICACCHPFLSQGGRGISDVQVTKGHVNRF